MHSSEKGNDARRLERLIRGAAPGLWLVVAAHPDDESIGASWVAQRARSLVVVFVTDGAPSDPGLRSRAFRGSREEYAALRHAEATAALGLLDGEVAIEWLGFEDQGTSGQLVAIVEMLAEVIGRLRPGLIVTHAYEGGHPDHDAAAFATRAALALRRARRGSPLPLVEMTSYHAAEGELETGRFLPGARDELVVPLAADESERKRRMFAAYASQSDVLRGFGTEVERYRMAGLVDFSRAPHAGPLYFERSVGGMTGARFRALVRDARVDLGIRRMELSWPCLSWS